MTRLLFFLGSGLVALVACEGPAPAENKADQPEGAADALDDCGLKPDVSSFVEAPGGKLG